MGTMYVQKTVCPTLKSYKVWFLTEILEPNARALSWQWHNGYFVFLWCTFLVPSLKKSTLIFLKISLIQYFTILEQFMMSSLSSFA